MPLWGKSTTNEAKPRYLSAEDALNTRATTQGWVLKRPDGTDELLVAIGGLSTSLAAADVTDVFFANTAASYVQGNANSFITVGFNEAVVVTGSPTIAVAGATPATATYASGSGSNKLLFKFTVPAVAQTLSIAPQSITLAGGTIKDQIGAANVSLVIQSGDVKGVRGKPGAVATVAVA